MSDTKTATKRFAITLDRVLVGLLLVEGLLFLSDQYDWFAFNQRKGWTVLTAGAVVSGVLLLTGLWAMASWAIARWTRGKPFQFELRSGLLLVVVVGLACGWLAGDIQRARQQAEVRAEIAKTKYAWCGNPSGAPDVPKWLTKLLGSDFFVDVTEANVMDDEGLLKITGLPQLERLYLDNSPDRGVMESILAFPQEGKKVSFPFNDEPRPRFSIAALRKVESMADLKAFHLYNRDLPSSELASLNLPASLEEVRLSGSVFDDSTLAAVGKLPYLRTLRVISVHPTSARHGAELTLNITDAGLEHLSGLTELRELSLCRTLISDDGLAHLRGLRELRKLDVAQTKIEGRGLEHLKGLSNLESLDLAHNKLSNDRLKYLTGLHSLKNLKLLRLDGVKMSQEGMNALRQALPGCQIRIFGR